MCTNDKEEFLKKNLSEFLDRYLPGMTLSDIDEIGVSYLVSILEDLGCEQDTEEVFDVDQFIEMMEAYLPGFCEIDSVNVSEWMFKLSHKLTSPHKHEKSNETSLPQQPVVTAPPVMDSLKQNGHIPLELPEWPNPYKEITKQGNPFSDIFTKQLSLPEPAIDSIKEGEVRIRTQSLSAEVQGGLGRIRTLSTPSEVQPAPMNEGERCRTQSTSSTASSSDMTSSLSGDYVSEEESDENVQILVEMFPNACAMEINHCLGVVNGDTERAAQLILTRQECGQSITNSAAKKKGNRPGSKKSSCAFLDDPNVKKSIINKYAYVDLDADKKQHKPSLRKSQDRKMVRYLDSKIVTTRGERFTEIKKDDEEKMKKTFVNLKPAKQYRFH